MIGPVARLLFPFSLVVALALLVRSYAEVGDGFAAGAVAALGAVAQYVCLSREQAHRITGAVHTWWYARLGLLLALVVVLSPSLWGVAPVTHVPAPGRAVISVGMLELHTALLFDLGVALLVYGTVLGTFDRLLPPYEERAP